MRILVEILHQGVNETHLLSLYDSTMTLTHSLTIPTTSETKTISLQYEKKILIREIIGLAY